MTIPTRRATVLLAAIAALLATAFTAVPAPSTTASVSRLSLDAGLTMQLDTTRRVPVSLSAPTTIDVRDDGPNALAVQSTPASDTSGFVLVRSDTTDVVAAVINGPLGRFGVDSPVVTYGRGREADGQPWTGDLLTEPACGVCELEAGEYELVVLATSPTTVTVRIGSGLSPVEVDTETRDAVSAPWHISRGGNHPKAHEFEGPAVGSREVGSLIVCSGCALPATFIIHQGMATAGPDNQAVGTMRVCTGESPFDEEDCARHVAGVGTSAPQPYTDFAETQETSGPIGASTNITAASLTPNFQIALATVLIPIPQPSQAAFQEPTNVKHIDFVHSENR